MVLRRLLDGEQTVFLGAHEVVLWAIGNSKEGASEIRFRDERRLGELMQAQRETVGLSAGGRPSEKTGSTPDPVSKPATLSEAGIDKPTP